MFAPCTLHPPNACMDKPDAQNYKKDMMLQRDMMHCNQQKHEGAYLRSGRRLLASSYIIFLDFSTAVINSPLFNSQ